LLHRSLAGLTPEQALARPGGANPIVWIAAHVVAVRAGFAKGLGAPVDVPWAEQFPRGGKLEDVTEWPALVDVLAYWDEVHAVFMAALESLTPAALAAETKIPGLDKTLLGAIGLAALHDSYHVGQIGAARRLHGLDRIVG
jgi:hypothetical protein